MTTSVTHVEMEVFRAGNYGPKGTYDERAIQQLVDDYRTDLFEAPLTFDHAQSGPAYGWVSGVRRKGDRLIAVIAGVPDAVRDLVRSGAYKNRSIELFRNMPETGRPYLRAVSLLGAAVPEVKGLRDIRFAAQAADCVRFRLDESPESVSNGDEAARLVEELKDELDTLRRRLVDQRLNTLFTQARESGAVLAKRDEDMVRGLVLMASRQDEIFADGDLFDWLSGFLRRSTATPPLGESASPATPGPGVKMEVAFQERTDPVSFALHQRAAEILAASPGMAYRDALLNAASAIPTAH